jgi:hypothetical protein
VKSFTRKAGSKRNGIANLDCPTIRHFSYRHQRPIDQMKITVGDISLTIPLMGK